MRHPARRKRGFRKVLTPHENRKVTERASKQAIERMCLRERERESECVRERERE